MPKRYFWVNGKERVAVTDIDGVLADSAEPVVRRVNKMYGLDLQTRDIDDWNWVAKKVEDQTGSKEEGLKAGSVWFDPEVLSESLPIAGAQEAITRLLESKWKVWAATSRLPNAHDSTLDWINEFFSGIGSSRVYMRNTENMSLVTSAEIKLMAVGMLGARLYVEDDHLSVEYVSQNWGNGLVIAMLNRGWNKKADGFETFRVDDWNGVLSKALECEIK
jgi:5'(3')-deoxyribonucleotidase